MTANPLESTVETHIDSTSRLVRRVDIAFSLLIVISFLLGGLFLAVIADHWLLKEGLSIPLRLGIFAALLAVAGLYTCWRIVPLFRYQINPIYTADLIEKDVSTFKNSLINWLLLRQEREERTDLPSDKINDRMYDGIVKTAAVNVQNVPAGHAVDVRKLMITAAVFTMLFAGFVAYTAFSPKNPFASLARVLFPFGNIERPQAARFRNINPGNAVVLQGETITISAEVVSQSSESVYLMFSTDDGQAVKQRIPMSLPEGKKAFETLFPPGKQGMERGFNSSVDYWIAQGESRSKQYRLDVQPAASVEIVSLQYEFPEYTGLATEIVEHGGDIRALEGTTVTVNVRSTLPLQKIDLVYDDHPANNVSMRVVNDAKTEAKGTFVLKTPFPYKTFAFLATDENGNASRRSGIYRIEVIPDQPPRVQWADTAKHLMEDQIDLPVNETLKLPIQAEDPDFALRYLRFKVESPGKRIPDVQLLDSHTSGPTKHRGQIKKPVLFSPAEKRLAVGDTAEIWVEAHDTKLPEANVRSTRRIRVNVIDPKAKEEEEQEQNEDSEKQPQEKGEQDKNQERGADETDEKDSNQEGKEGEQGEGSEGQQGLNEREGGEGGEREEGKQNQDQNGGGSGENDPSGEQQENGNQSGNAGNEPGEEGEQSNNGEGKEGGNVPEQQPDEAQKGEGGGGERTGNEAEQETSVNPETQDGDAMERIVEQMKEEGLFPGANPFLRNDNQRMRNDGLDPNSQNRSNRGNDPSNPKESNQPSDGEPQGQPDKPKDEGSEGETNSGQTGDMDSQSGNNEGSPQDGEGAQDSQPQGSQGGEQGDSGDQQQKQEGEGGGSGNQQPPNTNPQGSSSGDPGSPSEMGGTGGGTSINKETAPDDPNLKYANEVTNMVLDYLENQLKDKPNDELLKRLGWTDDQLRQFYDKWKKMSENSKQPRVGEEGPNAWLEALKSMGLLSNQNRRTIRGSQTRMQDNQRVTEAQRIPVPPAIQGRFKEYNDNLGK